MDRWMSDRVGLRGLFKGTKQNLPYWLDRLPDLPNKAIDLIDRLRDGRITVQNKSSDIEKLRKEIRESNQRTVLAIIGSTFVLCAAIIYGLDKYSPFLVNGIPVVSAVLAIVGLVLLAFAMED
jgi:ubiquinone biosynthesis protein